MTATINQLRQLREYMQPSPVEREKFPCWFRLREGDKLPQFFDHWGRTIVRGQSTLVAEPYYMTMHEERWDEVRRFAIEYDLQFTVMPNSYHFPGETLRITFWDEDHCPLYST